MATQDVKRKLTTILVADVEGYTRLMHADEEATLRTLGEYREIIATAPGVKHAFLDLLAAVKAAQAE